MIQMRAILILSIVVRIWTFKLTYLFFYFFFLPFFFVLCLDEENVEEETRKHKEIYFNESINSRSNTKATTSATRNANIEMSDAAKPTESTNFLFSNENDSCEDNDIDDL